MSNSAAALGDISTSITLPERLQCNVRVPYLSSGSTSCYFFPDTVLIYSDTYRSVGYDELSIHASETHVKESATFNPSDSEIAGYEWKHPNNDGGRDNRRKNNYTIPVMRFGVLQIGFGEEFSLSLMLSKTGAGEKFAVALRDMATRVRPTSVSEREDAERSKIRLPRENKSVIANLAEEQPDSPSIPSPNTNESASKDIAYAKSVLTALEDGIITDDERALLDMQAGILKLHPNQQLQIEKSLQEGLGRC